MFFKSSFNIDFILVLTFFSYFNRIIKKNKGEACLAELLFAPDQVIYFYSVII